MSDAISGVLDSLPVAVAAFDPRWRFTYANRLATEILGEPEKGLIGRTLWEAFPRAGAAPVRTLLEQAMVERKPTEFEGKFLDERVRYEVNATPVPDGVAVSFRKASGRGRSETSVQADQDRLRLMVRSVKDYAIILLDREGYIVEWNPGAERVKGYRAEDILGKHMSVFYSEEDRERGKPARILAAAAAHEHYEDEGWRVRKDGTLFWASVVLTQLRDDQGEIVGFSKITRDLTERHRKEEEHRRQAEMGQLLHDAAQIANESAFLDEALHKTFERMCSRTGCMFGNVFEPAGGEPTVLVLRHSWSTVEAERYGDFIRASEAARFAPGDDLSGNAYQQARPAWIPDVTQAPEFVRAEAAAAAGFRTGMALPILAGGEVVAVMELFSDEPLEVDDLLLETLADMGVQLGRIAERQHAANAIRRANQAKSDFLSRMSHELRTPLNAILGFGQLLEMDRLDPEQRESVALILKAGRHLLNLINEVLDIARVESGRIALSPEPVRVQDVLQDAMSLLIPAAQDRRVLLPARLPTLCERHVYADRQRLKQVLLNLIANAIKYNREGGTVSVSCADAGDGRLRIDITDTGPGISPEKQRLLFSPFERLDADRSSVEGSGLGLALSKALIEAMGGRIGLESEISRGSTFWIELPLQSGHIERYEREVPSAETLRRPDGPERKRRLLYIEDNLSNLKLVQRILSLRPGIELIPAMQGSLGLELALKQRPDLILLDIHLPDIMGEEVLLRLNADERTAAIPVIVISADATVGQIQRFRESGVQDYLTKPFDVKQFLEAVDRGLGLLGSEQEA